MGGGVEEMETEVQVGLSTGALEAMWREDGLRPVLQLADAPQMAVGGGPPAAEAAGRYLVALSDGGGRLQPGMLAASLNHLVAGGALRRGTVVRVLEYFAGFIRNERIIIVIQLEILQAECTLIGCPTIYEAKVQHTSGLQEPYIMPCTQQVISNSSCYPAQGFLNSSITARAEPTVNNLPFSECFSSMPARSTIDTKMQQLSLNGHENQRFTVTATDSPGLSCVVVAQLTPGAVAAVSEHVDGNGTLNLVLQLVDVRMVHDTMKTPGERFRMVLSDGVYTMQSMLATAENMRVQDRSIKMGSIIHLQEFTCSTIQNRRMIIVIKLDVLQSECKIMGNPKPYEMRYRPNEQVPNLLGAPGNTYGQPAQSFYQQPPPGHTNRTLVSKNDSSRLVPVAQLNPYQERWTIKARVTSKTDLRHYHNARGGGKVFSFDLLDGQGGEIRVTCFNAQADQFFDLIEVHKVYLISKGLLKEAQKKFNSLNHEYEITLDFKSSVEACVDDSNIPRQQYNFRQISEIENIEISAIVDLIGIVTSVGPSATIMRKDDSEDQKRTLQLKDMSGRSIEITLWGKFCDAEGQQLQLQCDSGLNPILSLKGGRVTDFSGRSVVTISSTQLKVNPDFPMAERLKQWYITEGKNTACISLSLEVSNIGRNHVPKTIAQIKDENLGLSDKPDYITVRAELSHVGADIFCYQACTLELNGKRCHKKVMRNADGTWYCDRCSQCTENCEYKYLFLCQIKDHTGTTHATAFQEAGEAIFGHTVEELYMIRNVEEDVARFTEIMEAVLGREYLFKLRLRVDEQTYNGEQRVRCSILGVEKLEATNNLLKDVSRPILKDDMSYTPNVGSINLEARQSMETSSGANGCATGVGATGFAQSDWMPTPLSVSSEGFDFNGALSSESLLCFRCN